MTGGRLTMYATHFCLRQRPFRSTPDSSTYYPATSHERALAALLQALADGEGIALLTGEPGTGKTLLCHCLLERLGEDTTSAFLTHSHLRDRVSLLQTILFDLSLPYEGRSEQELRLALTDFLLKNFGEGRRTVLVMDEAQHLSADLLEELRMLGNLEARHGKALQVVLASQPSLLEKLRYPPLSILSQRLAVRVTLEPFTPEEAADCLFHQLRSVGARPEEIVSEEAAELLARGSRGVPRLLNQAAHQAFSLAFMAGVTEVDAEAALEALTCLGLQTDDESPSNDEAGVAQDEPARVITDVSPEHRSDPPAVAETGTSLPASDDPPKPGKTGRPHRLFASPRRPA